MASDLALIVMAKAPRPGRVKTRLCPPLSPGDAARLYACMLADTASEMAALARVRRYLFIDRPDELVSSDAPHFSAFERMPQLGKDLGDRMARAATVAFRDGARSVAIVGADCPTLSAGKVRQAFRELDRGAGAVFAPSTDGGFCLVGLSSPDVRLFRGIAWSAPTVLREVAARCRERGTPFAFLSQERDIDAIHGRAAHGADRPDRSAGGKAGRDHVRTGTAAFAVQIVPSFRSCYMTPKLRFHRPPEADSTAWPRSRANSSTS